MKSRRLHRVAAVSLNLASSTDVSSGIHPDMYPSGCSIYSHLTVLSSPQWHAAKLHALGDNPQAASRLRPING